MTFASLLAMTMAEAGAQPSAGFISKAMVTSTIPNNSVGNLSTTVAGIYPLPCDTTR